MNGKKPSKEELETFFERDFPQASFVIEEVGERSAKIRKRIDEAHLRPGGTVSGPVLMAMADAALYVALLGEIGLVPLAVTTSFTINFLRKPEGGRDVIAVCNLIKVGKLLATGEISIYSEGVTDRVAHAVGTYAIPPRSSR